MSSAPVANPDFWFISDTPALLPAGLLLGNDVDADGDSLTVTAVDSPVNGAVTLTAGVVTFTPAAGSTSGSFSYTVSDGLGGTDSGLVTIEVDATGKASDTVLVGGAALFSYVLGQGGDDNLTGQDGRDSLSGAVGNDSLEGGSGEDSLLGGSESDTLQGGAHNDTLSGGVGIDSLDGGMGNDSIRGGADNDLIQGAAGNDTLDGGDGGGEFVSGGADTLDGGPDADLLLDALSMMGGEGNDTLLGGLIDDNHGAVLGEHLGGTLEGGGGDDLLVGNHRFQVLFSGDDGDDTIFGGGRYWRGHADYIGSTIYGGAGDDHLEGTEGNDTIDGGGDNDTVVGGFGNDVIHGGDGNDYLDSSAPDFDRVGNGLISRHDADDVDGGAGNDTIVTGERVDTLHGGADNDLLDGGAGADVLDGGDGLDIARYTGGRTFDLAAGTGGSDTCTSIEGILSDIGNQSVFGSAVDNILSTGRGRDHLDGREGDDTLIGGEGVDRFTGGSNQDTFVVGSDARDIITDFSHAEGDKIDLTGIDADSSLPDDQAFVFIGGSAFGHVAGELRAQDSGPNTIVQGDTDGDGDADLQILLAGHAGTSLVSGDFLP